MLDLGVQSAILTVPWAGLIGTGSYPGGHRDRCAARREQGRVAASLRTSHLDPCSAVSAAKEVAVNG